MTKAHNHYLKELDINQIIEVLVIYLNLNIFIFFSSQQTPCVIKMAQAFNERKFRTVLLSHQTVDEISLHFTNKLENLGCFYQKFLDKSKDFPIQFKC